MASLETLIDDTYALIYTPSRSIGGIIPDCAIEEVHSDQLVITEHPVETGAAISDHAYKRPAEVEMRIGFSDSSAGYTGWVQEAYELLLALQAEREPFLVSTGKRQYTNMLIASIAVTTDGRSEYALNCTVGLRQVIITYTDGSGSAQNADMALPQVTGTVQQSGSRNIIEAGSAVLPALA